MVMRYFIVLLSTCLLFGCFAEKRYDVVVYGGTPAGISAAINARQSGADVLLISPHKHIGGALINGVIIADVRNMIGEQCGTWNEHVARIQNKYAYNDTLLHPQPHVSEQVFEEMLSDADIKVVRGLRLEKVALQRTKIQSIILDNRTGEKIEVSSKVFIDATYEGDLMAMAGISYVTGREPASQYNESRAGVYYNPQDKVFPIDPYDEDGNLLPGISTDQPQPVGSGDNHTMAFDFHLSFSIGPDRIPFAENAPDGYNAKEYELLGRFLDANPDAGMRDLMWFGKNDGGWIGNCNKPQAAFSYGPVHYGDKWAEANWDEREQIYDNYKRFTEGYFFFIKTDHRVPESLRQFVHDLGLDPLEYQDNDYWPYEIYVRESRRMVGEYVVSEKDMIHEPKKADWIARGSHRPDSHNVMRVAVPEVNGFRIEGRYFYDLDYAYDIPYRAIVPKREECTNLINPVTISSSRFAMSSIRVEPTWIWLGESAGKAAAWSAENNVAVQDFDLRVLNF